MPLPRSVASQHQARDCGRKKVGGGTEPVGEEGQEEEIQAPWKDVPKRTVARGPKLLAEQFHQPRTGHCHTGQYVVWTKNADTECG